jgi:hypothetical protein
MAIRFIVPLLFMLTFSSCAVGPQGTYFHPSYPDNSVTFEGGWCGGAAGPPAVVKFSMDYGAQLYVSLKQINDGGVRLMLSQHIPYGVSTQFAAEDIRITNPKQGSNWVIKPKYNQVIHPISPLSPEATIEFEAIFPVEGKYITENLSILKEFHVSFPVSLEKSRPDSIELLLPNIVIDNKEFNVPAVKFAENKVQPEYDWWPDHRAFTAVSGKWSSLNGCFWGATATGDDGGYWAHINFSCPPDIKWRFASREVRMVLLGTSEERLINFDEIRPSYPKVNFTTPIINRASRLLNAYAVGSDDATGLALDSKDRDEVIVELPDIIINGKRRKIKPISFKKSIGFGIIPFNC